MTKFVLVVLIIVFIISRIVFSYIEVNFRKLKNEKEADIGDKEGWEYDNYKTKIKRIEENEKQLDRIRKISTVVLLIIFLINTVCSSVYVIGEQNLAIVTTFGKAEAISGTGIHFKIPYIQNVKKLDSTIKGFAIGYQEISNEEEEQEEENKSEFKDSLMITSDFNFVNVDFYVEYRIGDPIDYLYGTSDPEGVLRNISLSAIRNTIGTYPVDSVLTTGKSEIQSAIKEDIVKTLEKNHTGLTLINITIQDAEPPTEDVKKAFKNVETAKQKADEALNKAEQYENEQIPKAEAEADSIINKAKATKQERIDEATGEVALFNAMYEEYKKDPDISKMRIYYETMEELMPNLKVIVNGTDSELKPVIVQN